MRSLMIILSLAFCGMVSAEAPPIKLEDFNRSPPWDGASAEVSDDPNLIAQFQGKDFVCRNVADFTPKESDAAARAFNEFVEYTIIGDKVDNFWMDAAHKQKREDLLNAALKAGSWKADYLDSVWIIRRPKDAETAKKASAQLVKLVEKGVPIAAYKYATYQFGRNGKDMYYLFNAAIDRGSPHAMTSVGTTIVVQSKALRPLGKALLECAVSQGHADAYKGLGTLADMEGRRLDAYRLWEKGVNEGCIKCIGPMENIAKARDYTPDKLKKQQALMERLVSMNSDDAMKYLESTDELEPRKDLVPELTSLKKFHKDNFFYELTKLPDFERRPPAELAFHPSDSELLLLLQLEKKLRK